MSQPPASLPGRRGARGRTRPPTTRHQVLARAAAFAVQAPSGHDVRPWQLEPHPDRLLIRTDRSGQRSALDPRGRELVESAGAALFNVRVALASGGWRAEVQRLPRPEEPDVLADVRPVAGAADGALAVLAPFVGRPPADGRRVTGVLVPDDVLTRLVHIAETEGVVLIPVVAQAHRRLVAGLIHASNRTTPAGDPLPRDADQSTLLLATRTDDAMAWLRAGEAMQHVLLEVNRLGWAGRALTRPIEVPLDRTRLRAALTWNAHPQMLLRIGPPEP